MTKILYITNGIKGAGGLERVLSIKASYLADHLGYEVHILVLNNDGAKPFYDFSEKIIMHDIAVGGHPWRYYKQFKRGIKTTVGKVNPDIISVCDDGLKGFFIPLLLRKRCPIIYERHVSKIVAVGASPSLLKSLKVSATFGLMNRLGSHFDKFVVLTEDNRVEWRVKNLIVIPNPLSFYPEQSSKLNRKIVIAVGKQAYQKGFDRMLEIWKTVIDRHPDWQLHIYGKKDPSLGLPETASALGISDSVSFFDPVKNIDEKFLEASVFAFPSRFEGFGMVLIEAMACGLPCVSFDCPCGPSDIVSDGQDGFLVANGDLETFADRLATLMDNANLRTDFGQKAKANAKEYLPENIMPKWNALFKSLIG